VNYYSHDAENCYSTIGINYKKPNYGDYYQNDSYDSEDDDGDDDYFVGINCFDELLLKSEFISYAKQNF
jgi:hypothetical protein